jgi:hypothetical protein
VLLALLAHEEPDQTLAPRDGDCGAGEGDRRHHGPSDRPGVGVAGGGGDQLSGGEEAGRPKQGAAGVDVVGGVRAAGEGDLAENQRVLAQLGDQRLLGVLAAGQL